MGDGRPTRVVLIDGLGFERLVRYDGGDRVHYGGPRGQRVCFDLVGARTLADGEVVYVAEEESRRAPPRLQPQTVTKFVTRPPDVEALARALFETDPEVRAFVASVADAIIRTSPSTMLVRWGDQRATKATQIAWDRDERGWRTAKRRLAREIVDGPWLRQGAGESK